MSDQWTDRLSEYLDDELAPEERAEIERHLAGCADCSGALEELHAVVRRAAVLPEAHPAADLWPGIAARIGAKSTAAAVVVPIRRARRLTFTFTIPQLAAAGVALLLAGGGGAYLLAPRAAAVPVAERPAAPAAGGAAARPAGTAPAPEARLAASTPEIRQYQATVDDLQRVLDRGRDRLQPETIQALERNLAVIDAAIADARRALARDPANAYLNEHLAESMRRKVELLRVASTIINARS